MATSINEADIKIALNMITMFKLEDIGTFITENGKELVDDLAGFMFQGYDPKRTLAIMMAINLKIEAEPGKALALVKKDLVVLSCFYLQRGTRISRPKVLDNMDKTFREILVNLTKKYTIKDQKPDGRDIITIPRVIGAVPHYPAYTIYNTPADTIRLIGFSDDLGIPPVMCYALFPSCIPKGPEWTLLFNKWFIWADVFVTKLQEGTPRDNTVIKPAGTLEEAKKRQREYANISRQNGILSEADRIKVLTSIGFKNDGTGTIEWKSKDGKIIKLA